MGMPIVSICATSATTTSELADVVFDWFETVDAALQHLQSESEISRLNRGRARGCRLPPRRTRGARALRRAARTDRGLLRRALRLAGVRRSLGAREGVGGRPRRRAARDAAAVRNYSLNAAGDMRMRGERAAGGGLAGRDPAPAARPTASRRVVECNDLALATSGAYARGDHVLDPHTGTAPSGLALGDDRGAELAHRRRLRDSGVRDGRGRPDWARTIAPYEALLILADGRPSRPPGFPLADSTGPPSAGRS